MVRHRIRKKGKEREDTRRTARRRRFPIQPEPESIWETQGKGGEEQAGGPSLLSPSPLSQVSTQFPDCPGRLLNHLGTSPATERRAERHLDSLPGHFEIQGHFLSSSFRFLPVISAGGARWWRRQRPQSSSSSCSWSSSLAV